MSDDDIALLRRAAQGAFGWAASLPEGPWTVEENDFDTAAISGFPWDPDTYWVTAPHQPEETRMVALAYGDHVGEYLTRLDPRLLRALGMLFNAIAGEYEGMRRSALYLDVSDKLAAERLRRGPAGLGSAVVAAQALLGMLEEIEDDEENDDDV